ncbi:ATP synthase F1 subcomplex gamma subunit [Singulisphaera sp. GP187]|uniref:ATP synthase F1 subunit gamma n=1 Tax=Singulisphaera sp. GP187 TaxID=1882752 RepID=UPI0009299126|nr:ATP synthase F1 subunit gamma [Singulisphaera sp. GP187]SIO21728.1 ATP synthase F1 subcomplex gamma subunit [Singulisphaera sp. GP187]
MAKARAIVKRRKSVQNIRKITRTMELIATARFKKALDRATEAEAYTRKIAELVANLGATSLDVSHPLLEVREPVRRSLLLVLSSNRGLAGGYNGNVLRVATRVLQDNEAEGIPTTLEVAGKRGINYFRFRGTPAATSYTQFEDRPQFDEIEALANKYIGMYIKGEIDRLDVSYTQFVTSSRQTAVVQTLLPMTTAQVAEATASVRQAKPVTSIGGPAATSKAQAVPYEFLPDSKSILEEIVPVSFKVRLFKCFLDAAVSEQIARMVAMRGATENADDMIKSLTRLYNRARQAQITRELAELIGGAAALE